MPDPFLAILNERSLSVGSERPLPVTWSPAALSDLGFRWFVLHPDSGDESQYRALARDLAALCQMTERRYQPSAWRAMRAARG